MMSNSYRFLDFLMTLVISVLVFACGKDELDEASELKGYRLLTVQSDIPIVNFTDQPTLTVIDYHPDELKGNKPEIEYEWKICPFSIGSSVAYACFVDEIDLESKTNTVTIALPLILQEAFSKLPGMTGAMMMGDPTQAIDMISSQLPTEAADLARGVDLYVKVKSTIKSTNESFNAVKRIKLNIDPMKAQSNQNPTLQHIRLYPQLDSYQKGQEIKIEAVIDPMEQEAYQSYYTATINDEKIEKVEEKTEEFVISWFATQGSWEFDRTLVNDDPNVYTVGDQEGNTRIYVMVNDGRGGIAIDFVEIKVVK